MHPVDRRDETVLQFARHRLVRREHEFLDQLVRFIVFDSLELDRLAFRIETHLYFREIEIERALVEALSAQERGQFPGDVQPFA